MTNAWTWFGITEDVWIKAAPERLRNVSGKWGEIFTHAGEIIDQLNQASEHLTHSWTGPAADAYRAHHHRRQQLADSLAVKVWQDPDLIFTTSIGTAPEPATSTGHGPQYVGAPGRPMFGCTTCATRRRPSRSLVAHP